MRYRRARALRASIEHVTNMPLPFRLKRLHATCQAIKNVAPQISEMDITLMLATCDVNSDGKITYEEWAELSEEPQRPSASSLASAPTCPLTSIATAQCCTIMRTTFLTGSDMASAICT